MTTKGFILYVLVFGLVLVLIGLTSVVASGGNYLALFYINILLLIVFLTAIYEISKLKG